MTPAGQNRPITLLESFQEVGNTFGVRYRPLAENIQANGGVLVSIIDHWKRY